MSAINPARGYLPTGHTDASEAASHAPALTGGEIAGIVLAVVVAVVLGALAVYYFRRWWRNRKAARARALEQGTPPRAPRSPRRRQDPAANLGEEGRHAEDVLEQPGAVATRGDSCRLCTAAYDLEAGDGPHTLDCGDTFHRRCIRRWMQNNLSCPLCNATQIALFGDADGEFLKPRLRCSTSNGADRRMSSPIFAKDDISVGVRRSSSFGA